MFAAEGLFDILVPGVAVADFTFDLFDASRFFTKLPPGLFGLFGEVAFQFGNRHGLFFDKPFKPLLFIAEGLFGILVPGVAVADFTFDLFNASRFFTKLPPGLFQLFGDPIYHPLQLGDLIHITLFDLAMSLAEVPQFAQFVFKPGGLVDLFIQVFSQTDDFGQVILFTVGLYLGPLDEFMFERIKRYGLIPQFLPELLLFAAEGLFGMNLCIGLFGEVAFEHIKRYSLILQFLPELLLFAAEGLFGMNLCIGLFGEVVFQFGNRHGLFFDKPFEPPLFIAEGLFELSILLGPTANFAFGNPQFLSLLSQLGRNLSLLSPEFDPKLFCPGQMRFLFFARTAQLGVFSVYSVGKIFNFTEKPRHSLAVSEYLVFEFCPRPDESIVHFLRFCFVFFQFRFVLLLLVGQGYFNLFVFAFVLFDLPDDLAGFFESGLDMSAELIHSAFELFFEKFAPDEFFFEFVNRTFQPTGSSLG